MNAQIKTVLLTILTLSVFVIALVELSGVSSTALFNKYGIGSSPTGQTIKEEESREAKASAMPKTTIQFLETKHDFGSIKEGDKVRHAYKFKNTGTNPLLISKITVGCGCTTPSFSKEPIAPGGEGEIVIEFNSSGKEGHQEKNAIVHSNAQMEAMSIGFTADVKK
ncbi:MAG TPA: DUF1573 domain-containing protein [Flavipsychrobacter sp.]|nr:DUF1573 domain-containing protein [Flavipsychrobacter sp.]